MTFASARLAAYRVRELLQMTDSTCPDEDPTKQGKDTSREDRNELVEPSTGERLDSVELRKDAASEASETESVAQTSDAIGARPEDPPKDHAPRLPSMYRLQLWQALAAVAAVLVAIIALIVSYHSQPPRNATELELRRYSAEQWGDSSPTGTGPWRILVVAGSEVPEPAGLRVWSSPRENAEQIGSVGDRQYVWASCRIDSGYDPFPNAYPGFGSVWYGITWPNQAPGREFYNSSRNDKYMGYVWEGAVVAWGQNGDLPNCP